jgi:replicative DNA helicase
VKRQQITPNQIDVLLSGKGLPASLEAERLTLGSAIAYPESQPQIVAECQPEWFTLEQHRVIFATLANLYAAGEPADRVTIAQALHDSGKLESAGGLAYLMELDAGIPASLNIDGYMRVMREKWVRRQAISTGYAMIHQAMTDGNDDSIATTLERYMTIAGDQKRGGLVSVADHVEAEGMDAVLAPDTVAAGGISLPWASLAAMTGMLLPNQITTIAAPTGTGKSSFVRQIIAAAAMEGHCCALFSLEMSRNEVLRAMAATIAEVNSREIDRGTLGDIQRQRLARTLGMLEGAPIYIDEESDTTSAMDAKLRSLSARRPVGLVVVDHFHLLADTGGENRTTTLKLASNRLRRMARQHAAHVIVLCQYNRTGIREQKDDGPQLHHIEGTEALAQDSHRVFMLDPHRFKPGEPWPERIPYRLFIRKARKGGMGELPLAFERRLTRFHEDRPEQQEIV